MIKNVTYGTIKNMKVSLPDRAWSAMDIVNAFATAFVNHMTENCICSDDCLISSIGSSYCRKAMELGLEEIIARNPGNTEKERQDQQTVLTQVKRDDNWETAILCIRHGKRPDFIDFLIKHYESKKSA